MPNDNSRKFKQNQICLLYTSHKNYKWGHIQGNFEVIFNEFLDPKISVMSSRSLSPLPPEKKNITCELLNKYDKGGVQTKLCFYQLKTP